MTRKKKLLLNSISSLVYQVLSFLCGFVVPKMFLTYYGSAVNGLISSITQFLGFIALAECGVGAVVQSALYKPLADNNNYEVSKIVISSERFFRKIAYLLLGYTVVLMVVYPNLAIESFDYIYTMLLIFVMAINTFAQYYFGMTNRLLLSADQLGFMQFIVNGCALVLNTIISILLMKTGASIQVVKLMTSIVFLIQPIALSVVAKKRYKIDRTIILEGEPITQKWNGLAQHIAAVVLGNTDVVVLTLFSNLENVSIYAVYHLVVNGVKQIILSLINGVQAMFGNMLADRMMKQLEFYFESFEWLMHTIITLVFTLTAILILPFVRIYTDNIADVNYIVPTFAYLITLAQALYCIRLPYNIMVLAAGHYKQTQSSAIIEAAINVVISIVLVIKYEIVGVAIGTVMAMAYRTCYLVWYLSKNILHRKVQHFIKHIMVNSIIVLVVSIIVAIAPRFFSLTDTTYSAWFFLAIKTGITGVGISSMINTIFYKQKMLTYINKIRKKHRRNQKTS